MHKLLIPAVTIFITGISASGKSTLGKRLKENLVKNGINKVKLLDGEDLRRKLAEQGKNYGYSSPERNQAALEFARIAARYNQQGFVCILCSICHLEKLRQEMRTIIGKVMEVYLECPVSVCAQRDYKGNYLKAFKGIHETFIGVTEAYQRSEYADLILHTGKDSIEQCSQQLFESAISFLKDEPLKIQECVDKVEDTV